MSSPQREKDDRAAPDSCDDLRQNLDRRHSAVQRAAPGIRHHNGVDPLLDSVQRVLRTEDHLTMRVRGHAARMRPMSAQTSVSLFCGLRLEADVKRY
jgi:hypothetical protein